VDPMAWVLGILAALVALQGVRSLRQAMGHERSAARQRLDALALRLQTDVSDEANSIVREARGNGSLVERLQRFAPRLRAADLLVYRSGAPITVRQFYLLSTGLTVAGLFAGLLSLGNDPRAIACGLLGFAPTLVLTARKNRRMRQLEAQLPDSLDLIARSLRAGHSLTFGLQMVADEMPEPIGPEFGHAASQIALGLEPRAAIGAIADRVGTTDIAFFVTAVLIQRETGGNLAEILENLGHVIRERFKIYGKVRALTAQTRMSANILVAMPFVMVGLLSVVNKDYVKPLFETRPGHQLAMAALAMIAMGYYLCRRLGVVRV